ncbi:hypothetical protein EC988_009490 [Linderina pennispora]|nr:hypothetical protein EC988_009490 [Linderina pennispora]
MDDVYGATWFREEIPNLQLTDEKREEMQKSNQKYNYDKPFSIVDLAYRRINLDPWMPLPGDDWYNKLVSSNEHQYPYSSKTWRKMSSVCRKQESQPSNTSDAPKEKSAANFEMHLEDLRTFDTNHAPSEVSTQGRSIGQINANVTGRFHTSFLPGPYMCPIWADIESVDLYDVGSCSLMELATPELLAVKDIFCDELGIDPESVDKRVNLATIPGLANWVRSCLYLP